MIRTALAALLSIATAGQATALSCQRPSVQASFKAADGAETQYVVVLGRMRLLPGETIPDTGADPNDRQGYSVRARFQGKLAGAEGFRDDVAFPLTVRVDCAGPWCGGVPVDRVLAFVERRDEEIVLVEGPCSTWTLDATPDAVDAALSCLRGEECAVPK